MSKRVPYEVFLKGVVFLYFNMNKTTAETHHILLEVYDEHALTEQSVGCGCTV